MGIDQIPSRKCPGSPKTTKEMGFSPSRLFFEVGNVNHPKLGTVGLTSRIIVWSERWTELPCFNQHIFVPS